MSASLYDDLNQRTSYIIGTSQTDRQHWFTAKDLASSETTIKVRSLL